MSGVPRVPSSGQHSHQGGPPPPRIPLRGQTPALGVWGSCGPQGKGASGPGSSSVLDGTCCPTVRTVKSGFTTVRCLGQKFAPERNFVAGQREQEAGPGSPMGAEPSLWNRGPSSWLSSRLRVAGPCSVPGPCPEGSAGRVRGQTGVGASPRDGDGIWVGREGRPWTARPGDTVDRALGRRLCSCVTRGGWGGCAGEVVLGGRRVRDLLQGSWLHFNSDAFQANKGNLVRSGSL